jgi:hypothetical protein
MSNVRFRMNFFRRVQSDFNVQIPSNRFCYAYKVYSKNRLQIHFFAADVLFRAQAISIYQTHTWHSWDFMTKNADNMFCFLFY